MSSDPRRLRNVRRVAKLDPIRADPEFKALLDEIRKADL
jgi:hypothetical protein